MSSVDPRWPPPHESQTLVAAPQQPPVLQPPVQRPHRVAYVLAAILPVILLAAMAIPIGVAWAIARVRQAPSSVTTPPPLNPNATDGEPGLGDPYYPQAGNSGYDVTKYQIMINWDPVNQSITGTTTISARATQQLNSFYFDLVLHTDKVTVNGVPADSIARGFSDVYVKPAQPIPIGSSFHVVVGYSGKPGDIKQGDVQPWLSYQRRVDRGGRAGERRMVVPLERSPVGSGPDGRLDPGARRYGGHQRRSARVGRTQEARRTSTPGIGSPGSRWRPT